MPWGFPTTCQLHCFLLLKKLDPVISEVNTLSLHSRKAASTWIFHCWKKQALDDSHDIGAPAKLCGDPTREKQGPMMVAQQEVHGLDQAGFPTHTRGVLAELSEVWGDSRGTDSG